jgi:uncharacterized membrane protein YheB (UPF0754 family)
MEFASIVPEWVSKVPVFLLGLMLAGMVGLVHSWLAVKLVFWPPKPVYLWGWRVPMTPGLFVANRHRFAVELSKAITEQFMTPQSVHRALGQALESGEINRAINEAIVSSSDTGLTPIALTLAKLRIKSLKEQDIVDAAASISKSIVRSGAVDRAVVDGLAEMSPQEIEKMLMSVVHKELRVIIILGFPLGCASVIVHELVKWLLFST